MKITFKCLLIVLFIGVNITAKQGADEAISNADIPIENRLSIVKRIFEEDGRNNINHELSDGQNIVTKYFENIPAEDVRIDNEIIPYFFSRGLNFSGGKIVQLAGKVTHSINHFRFLLKADTKEILDQRSLLTQMCLFHRINTDLVNIEKDITFFAWILKYKGLIKLVNPNENVPDKNINKKQNQLIINNNVLNIIFSKFLEEKYDCIKDITCALQGTKSIAPSNRIERFDLIEKYKGIPIEHDVNNGVNCHFDEWVRYHNDKLGIKDTRHHTFINLLKPDQ